MIYSIKSRLDNLEHVIKQKDSEAERNFTGQNKQREREEFNRLQRIITNLTHENEKLKENYNDLEILKKNESENKRLLEEETFSVGERINELAERLNQNLTALEIEQNKRFSSEAELETYKVRIDKLKGKEAVLETENTNLKRDLDELRLVLEKALEHEHVNSARMLEENDFLKGNLRRKDEENEFLKGNLRRKDEEIEEFKARLIALGQGFQEVENKNNKLVDLLNQEIDKQAEDYKQKTIAHLLNSAQKSTEKMKTVIRDAATFDDTNKDFNFSSTSLASKIKGYPINEGITMERFEKELLRNDLMNTDSIERMFQKNISPKKLARLLRKEEIPQSDKTSPIKKNPNHDFGGEQFGLTETSTPTHINNQLVDEFNNVESPSKKFKPLTHQIPSYQQGNHYVLKFILK